MKTVLRSLLVLLSLAFVIPALRADERADIKARIDQRLPSLDRLKSSGAVGENREGYVEVRDGGGDAASIVAAENSDREKVYAAIAKQTNSSVEMVGRARARRIVAASGSGVWVQHEDGSWVRK